MKVNGKVIGGPRITTVVLPYGPNDEDFIVFKFRALTFKDNFEEIMPRPKPPKSVKPGIGEYADVDNPGFKKQVEVWSENKINWEFLRSISATENLEWESVKMDDPTTWGNWRKDLEDNFGSVEFNRIFGGFLEANMLSDEKLEEARNRFLASQVEKSEG